MTSVGIPAARAAEASPNVTEVNPALCRLFGYQAGELIGQPVHGISHPEDLALTRKLLERMRAGGADVMEVEKRYLHANGTVMDVMVNSAVMRDANGQAEYFISQLRDVTAQRHAERALQELNASLEKHVEARTRELEVANRRLESFVHGVSHDLRAPLRTIDGFATQLARSTEGQLDVAATEHLQRIRAASTRMATLIDGLLELARVNRVEMRPTQVDVSLLAEWALAELQDADPRRRADVQVQSGLEMRGDERLLKMLLSQLLANAWKFSATRDQVQIRVQGERKDDTLRLSIRDQGIGFDKVYSAKLFEPFQRLHGSDEGAGNGIGLTIAQQVAMRHGGNIRAEAELNGGACFHVELVDLQDQNNQQLEA